MKRYALPILLVLVCTALLIAADAINASPTIASVQSGACTAPCQATITATASDPDGSIVLYEWIRSGQVVASGPSASTLVVSFSAPVEADVDVRVTDNDGGQTTATAHVSVTEPPPPPADTTVPVIASLTPLNGSVVPRTGRVTVAATAADDTGVVSMDLYLDGVLVAISPNPALVYAWKVPGTKGRRYVITAVATDAAGNSGQATSTVTSSR
jgi:hypothetical protein